MLENRMAVRLDHLRVGGGISHIKKKYPRGVGLGVLPPRGATRLRLDPDLGEAVPLERRRHRAAVTQGPPQGSVRREGGGGFPHPKQGGGVRIPRSLHINQQTLGATPRRESGYGTPVAVSQGAKGLGPPHQSGWSMGEHGPHPTKGKSLVHPPCCYVEIVAPSNPPNFLLPTKLPPQICLQPQPTSFIVDPLDFHEPPPTALVHHVPALRPPNRHPSHCCCRVGGGATSLTDPISVPFRRGPGHPPSRIPPDPRIGESMDWQTTPEGSGNGNQGGGGVGVSHSGGNV